MRRDVFDEEKEPDGMVLRGEIPAVKGDGEEANGSKEADDDDDDVMIVDEAAAQLSAKSKGKRKREDDVDEGRRKKRLPEEKETEHLDTGVIDLL